MPKTHNRDSPRLRFTEEETAAPEQLMPEVPAAKAAKEKQPKNTPKLSFEESKPKRPSKVVSASALKKLRGIPRILSHFGRLKCTYQ